MYQDVRKAWTKKEETLKKCTWMSGKHGQKRGNTQEVYQDVRKAWTKKEEKSGCMESEAGGIVKAENEKGA